MWSACRSFRGKTTKIPPSPPSLSLSRRWLTSSGPTGILFQSVTRVVEKDFVLLARPANTFEFWECRGASFPANSVHRCSALFPELKLETTATRLRLRNSRETNPSSSVEFPGAAGQSIDNRCRRRSLSYRRVIIDIPA